MGFIRVRQVRGPAHEFDIAETSYSRNKDAYEVVNGDVVAAPRAVRHLKGRGALKSKRVVADSSQVAADQPTAKTSTVPVSANAAGPVAKTADQSSAAFAVGKE